METHDFTILTALFELCARIKLFISEDRDEIFNIELPQKKELLQRINKLINLDLIYCKDKNDNLIQKKIITELDINILLCLTEAGGEILNKKLNISWDEYIYEEVDYCDQNIYKITIQSASLYKIHKVLSFLPSRYQKQNIEISNPWFPVYWKKLSIGYKISVSLSEDYYISHLQNNEDYLQLVHPFYLKA